MQRIRVLALEPYLGGSHARFLEGLAANGAHEYVVWGMAPRKWKWRMRAAAVHFADRLTREPVEADVLLCSDFLDLAAFVGMRPEWAAKPKVVYFHENQLTYPLQDESLRDYHFAFTNITTCLAADRVIFNSAFHMREFLGAMPGFIRRMPDYRPERAAERIRERSAVIHPGIDLAALDRARERRGPRSGPATVLWSHRWEYDKAPEAFFEALFVLAEEGVPFRLCVLGESFRDSPPVFDEARTRLADRIEQFGFAESRKDYETWLARSDVFVSTAIHEFFGLAAVEAMAAGCYPLLPNRLSYPELLPRHRHARHLYAGQEELVDRLRKLLLEPEKARSVDLRPEMERFGWGHISRRMETELRRICA